MQEEVLRRALKVPVYDVAKETSLEYAPLLSKRLCHNVYLKREDLQSVFSFKLRGAYNKMVNLNAEQRKAGVIAASAGNHAQGVALSGNKLDILTTIVMPCTTPQIKVDAVKRLGSNVILYGDTYDEAAEKAKTLSKDKGYIFIHSYDDLDVIAGQATIALELLRQKKNNLDAIFIAVGGGGLIAGISAVIKQVSPQTKIIGVEPEDAACMTKALKKGNRVNLEQVGIFADGLAVSKVGKIPFKIAQNCVDEMITVTTDEICAGIKDVFEDTRAIAEPAGAVAISGMKKYVKNLDKNTPPQSLCAIVGGANINFDRLRHVSERTELGEKREAIFSVIISETPGSFKLFCNILGKSQITEFNYRYSNSDKAVVFVGISIEDEHEKIAVLKRLKEHDYTVYDMSDNEMAKLHLRYMVGGRAQDLTNEQLYRFKFPERPGALLQFLTHMSAEWNISLFHYRNHGSAYGRVLVGVQVQPLEIEKFEKHLKSLKYPFSMESDNLGYKLFLRSTAPHSTAQK